MNNCDKSPAQAAIHLWHLKDGKYTDEMNY